MIIKREKLYTEQPSPDKEKNAKAKKAGEVLGTAAIGAAGTIGGSKLLGEGAKKVASIRAGKKAKSEYREYMKGQDYRRLKGLEQIEAKRNLERAPYEGNWFKKVWNRSKLKDADYVAEGERSRLESKLKAEDLVKKKELIAKREAKIARAGKIGKRVGLAIGGALTIGGIAKKLIDKNKKGNEE